MKQTIEKTETPVDLTHDFPVQAPEYFNFGYDVVDAWAVRDRNKLAMIWANQKGEEKRYTFHDLSKLSNQAANLLIKHGITSGDRVMLMLPRLPEWWIFSLALIKLGAVQCPSPTLLTPQDIQHRIRYGKFKMVITDAENAHKFDEIYDDCPTLSARLLVDGDRPNWISYRSEISGPNSTLSRHEVKSSVKIRTRSDAPFLLMFTSGTSKYPKMVQHYGSYALAHRITAELWHGLTPNDLHMTISDTGWGKNLWGNYFGQWIIGACVLIFDFRGKFHADELLPVIEKYEVTSFCAPPTVYRMLTLNDLTRFDFSELKHCTTAGEPMQTETIRIWKESTGLTIREAYGQTETVCMIGNFRGFKVKPGSMGKPAPGWRIEIHDEDGKPLPAGEDGRIAVRLDPAPVGLFEKYLYNEPENKACFLNGFYYTGDRAYVDEDGYFWFVGRVDDIIKSSGYRIGPSEVEEVMSHHPSVYEVAVVGAPDPLRGMRVKAYVVLKPEFEATESLVRELQNYVKQETAPYKYPREIEFIKQMPKTFSGKIKRDILRRHAETGENNWEH
ncbi:AMP-binding protein [Victivallis vadensis]|uniref:AMP-binding protein n=1 Tax=Victivallis vadensis TaxID=172901 RepID=A0A2U1AUG6_9BACT|nr:AMP-binding protein [Victivallis vadensis]NMD88421.1 AMP-binding protein [Victivallis vadensis]PVY40079.1 acetyl-CoA synthetase [Victivallis vadensis]PWM74885.1 MAG: acyl-CoA synthetase [Lentisphaerota bacterium]